MMRTFYYTVFPARKSIVLLLQSLSLLLADWLV